MIYTAIDGDISDFFDAQTELTGPFRTDQLKSYLREAGHDDGAVITAVLAWQQHHFRQMEGSWERFELTDVGKAAVEELRDRAD
jgi:hypothetical protein